MATDEEVAGISIAIKADIKQAQASLRTLENQLGRITGKTVGISISQKSVREGIQAAVRGQTYTVKLAADRDSLIKDLGEIVIPVKGRWAGFEAGFEPPQGIVLSGGPTPSGETGGGVVPPSKTAKKAEEQTKAAVGAPAVAKAATTTVAEPTRTTLPPTQPKTPTQRPIGPPPITTLGGVPLEQNPLYQRYIAAGGDPAKFQAATPGPLPGQATRYLEEFPALLLLNRAKARTKGVDPRTERISGAVPPTLGMPMPGGGYLPRDEFNKLMEEFTGILKKGEGKAFLEAYPTSEAATEAISARVSALKQAQAGIPGETGPERALAQQAVISEAMAIGRLQRQEISRRSVSKKETSGMDPEDALALGATRGRQSYLRLLGGQPQEIGATRGGARRPSQARPIKSQFDVDVLTVRDIVTDIITENQAAIAGGGEAQKALTPEDIERDRRISRTIREQRSKEGKGELSEAAIAKAKAKLAESPKTVAAYAAQLQAEEEAHPTPGGPGSPAARAALQERARQQREAEERRRRGPAGLFGAAGITGPEDIDQYALARIQEDAARFQGERRRRSERAKAQLRGPGGRFAAAAIGAPATAVAGAGVQYDDLIKGLVAQGKTPEEAATSLAAQGIQPPAARTAAGGGGGGRRGRRTATGGAGGEEKPPEEKATPREPLVSSATVKSIIGEDVAEQIAHDITEGRRGLLRANEDIRSQGRAILEENPVRALSVAVSQILVNTIGGRSKLKDKLKVLNSAVDDANRAVNRTTKSEIALATDKAALEKATSDKDKERLGRNIKRREEIVRLRKDEEATRQAAVEEARRPIVAARARFAAATLAVGTVGVVGGTLLFGAALGAATLALEQLGIGLGRVFDRLTGFELTANKVIGSLADQAKSNGYLIDQTIAAAQAQAGFSYESAQATSAHLENRVAVSAGTKAFEEQLELLHAEQFARERGISQALIQTTGGFPIGQIGGQRSIRELIEGEFRAVTRERVKSTLPLAVVRGGGVVSREDVEAAVNRSLDNLRRNVEVFNDDAKRGGSAMQLVEVGLTEAAEAANTLKESLPDTEEGNILRSWVEAIAAEGFALQGRGGRPAEGMPDITDFLEGISRAPLRTDPRLLIDAQKKAIQTALELRGFQGRFERQEILPARAFMRQAAQPLVPLEETAAGRLAAQTTRPEERPTNFDATKRSIDAAQASLREYADQGERAAEALIMQAEQAPGGGGLMQQWRTAIGAVKQYGAAISALQIDMLWKQVNLQTKQYDEQLRVANRSLVDAQEYLTGIKQAGSDGLGILERQTREYSRQSTELGIQAQLLQQQLTQRQINFQKALATFTAPGTSPEERAARIEEAKIEADYAQQQLDIQKQQLAISQQVFAIAQQLLDINAVRAVTDLTNQIALLQEGRRVNIELALDQENLAAMNQAIAEATAQAESVLQQAIDIRTQILQIGASLASGAAASLLTFVNALFEAMGIAYQQAANAFSGSPYGGGQAYQYDQYGNLIETQGGYQEYAGQSGLLGQVNSATRMIVGEAGPETVAILRNPRAMEIPSGEGGTQITVIVTGNTVRNDEDIEELANRVALRVEEIMGRRASLFGLRAAR